MGPWKVHIESVYLVAKGNHWKKDLVTVTLSINCAVLSTDPPIKASSANTVHCCSTCPMKQFPFFDTTKTFTVTNHF